MAAERTTDLVAVGATAMTDEVGVITGEVTLHTHIDDSGAVLQRVQYKDADEWYRLTGSPDRLADGQDIDALHTQTVRRLSQGGHREE